MSLSVNRDDTECGAFDLHGAILVPSLRTSLYSGSADERALDAIGAAPTPLVPQARTADAIRPQAHYNSLAPPRCGGSQPRRNGYVSSLCAAKLAKGILIDIITAQTFSGRREDADLCRCCRLRRRPPRQDRRSRRGRAGQSLPAGQTSIGAPVSAHPRCLVHRASRARTAHKKWPRLGVDARHFAFARRGDADTRYAGVFADTGEACASASPASRSIMLYGLPRARAKSRAATVPFDTPMPDASTKIINRSTSRTFHSVRCIGWADGVSRKSGYRASRPGGLRKVFCPAAFRAPAAIFHAHLDGGIERCTVDAGLAAGDDLQRRGIVIPARFGIQ